jgi:hypothetical protein
MDILNLKLDGVAVLGLEFPRFLHDCRRVGLPDRKGAPASLDETAAQFFSALDRRGTVPEGRKK